MSCIVPTTKQGSIATELAEGAILAAAVDVFARLGFAAARVEDILAAAKIARRTFYKYFSSKEAVLAAIYEVATRQLLQAVRGAHGKDPLDLVRRGLDTYLDYHVENAALVRVLVEQAIRSDSPLHEGRKRFRAELVRILDQAVREKDGKAHDPLLYAALLSALEGVSLELLASGAHAKDVARAKKVMHLMLERVLS